MNAGEIAPQATVSLNSELVWSCERFDAFLTEWIDTNTPLPLDGNFDLLD